MLWRRTVPRPSDVHAQVRDARAIGGRRGGTCRGHRGRRSSGMDRADEGDDVVSRLGGHMGEGGSVPAVSSRWGMPSSSYRARRVFQCPFMDTGRRGAAARAAAWPGEFRAGAVQVVGHGPEDRRGHHAAVVTVLRRALDHDNDGEGRTLGGKYPTKDPGARGSRRRVGWPGPFRFCPPRGRGGCGTRLLRCRVRPAGRRPSIMWRKAERVGRLAIRSSST